MAENFSTYIETDPNSRITVTQPRVSWTNMTRNEDAYVYKDFGANYFSGNFDHRLTIRVTLAGTSFSAFWALANLVNDLSGTQADRTIDLEYQYTGGVDNQIRLREFIAGTPYNSGFYTLTFDTAYYLTIVRDEAVGTYGTLYCYIYSDEARATLLATLTLTLNEKTDFRYLYPFQNYNQGLTGDTFGGYTETLSEVNNLLPSVTQQALTSIGATTATGNGYITSLGNSSVTEHGHCWATTVNPTTADSKTTNGAGALGTFTSAITGLTAGTKYYVRAYATNSYGTSYSEGLSFISGSPLILSRGNLAIKGTAIHYVGYDGKEYVVQGTAA